MSAYWVNTVMEMRDPAKVAAYAELATPAIAAAGGRFLVRGTPAKVYESGLLERQVIIVFPSVEAAVGCYESEQYQAAMVALGDGAVRDLRISEGVE
ncbi:DUF1330 domain-containing protein [Nocardioides massiliensis]|uniref:Uncharacterized protein (DUF1330 family) n=1 Tax=Nocardioides massiliensis TaxID=1325935 RepID=A0ABT9NRB7_9ACTN|nr:DUF1330 domain-containing protein [Nocardioides massiliensis]MDP9822972.1 uncharacterized protein (DUF1330 family) [Nocardioides massiliensis]